MSELGPETVTGQTCVGHSACALVNPQPLVKVARTCMSRLTVMSCSTLSVTGVTELMVTPWPDTRGVGLTTTAVPTFSFERSTSTVAVADLRSPANPLTATLVVAGGPLTTSPTGGKLL